MTSPSPVVSAEISSPGKSSLTSWWKNLKQKNQQDDNQDIPINNLDNSNSSSKKHHHHHHHHHNIHNLLHSDNDQENNSSSQSNSNTTTSDGGKPIRPFLGFKSRSSFSVRPLSLYDNSSSHQQTQQLSTSAHSSSSNHEKLRLHRDSFIQQRQQEFFGDSQVFGVPLAQSIDIAEGKIFITSDDDDLVRYGRIPRVIASCGSFLKQNGLDIEGIFRVAGSARRVKQLQLIFSSPPDYGSKIDWDGFTVHDSASLFRKFLGSLPEPLIPLSLYFAFREPLQKRPLIVKWLKEREKKLVPSSNDTNSTTPSSQVNTTSKLPAKSTKSNLTSALSATKNQSESAPSELPSADPMDRNKIESVTATVTETKTPAASIVDESKSTETEKDANNIITQQTNVDSKVSVADDSTKSLATADAQEEATKVTETISLDTQEPAEISKDTKPDDLKASNETAPQESTSKKTDTNKPSTTIKKKSKKSEKLKKEKKEALKEYAQLFDKLPSLQKQLLFYILDLMAIFNEHADKNLMPAKNLAAVFQPSILSHTDHDMSPEEYALSSLVIEFMIQYSYKILPAAQVYAQKLNKNNTSNKSKKSLEDDGKSQQSVVHDSNNKDKITSIENNDTTNNQDTNTIPKSTSRSSLQNPDIIIEENQSEIESSVNEDKTETQKQTNMPISITQHNKTETLPPNSFQRFTRKHSKSLSSVQNPSDMLRVNSRKLPSPASSLGTSDYPSIKGNQLSLVVSNITDDGGISDSAMDTEDDDLLADSRTRSSSFEVSNKTSLLQSNNNNNNNSNIGSNLITPTSSEFPSVSPVIPSLSGNKSIHSSSPNVSPSKLSKVINADKQLESISQPPAIKVDDFFVQGSQNQEQQDNITPIKSNNSIYKSPNNITSSHSIISGSGSPSSHSGFLQHLTRPLSMFGSPRMRASSIDGSIDNSLSLKNVISSNESLKLSSPQKQNNNGLFAINTNNKNDSTGNLSASATSLTRKLTGSSNPTTPTGETTNIASYSSPTASSTTATGATNDRSSRWDENNNNTQKDASNVLSPDSKDKKKSSGWFNKLRSRSSSRSKP
ncbi:hypothetical protein B5S28_g2288 [[Candida] boidinii]|nr:hypothetical protein B5S28_g2288 [[Candida] boidinii]OWB62344.1 hypothetical protein B5S29_g3268 [[Candida] boidinii]